MSYKIPKVTSGLRSRDVPRTSILNISSKCISEVIFSVLVHQMCALDTKKSVIAHSFSFGERPMNVLKTSQSDTCSVTLLGRPQDVNLNIFHEIGFTEIFIYFLMPSAYRTLQSENKLKT